MSKIKAEVIFQRYGQTWEIIKQTTPLLWECKRLDREEANWDFSIEEIERHLNNPNLESGFLTKAPLDMVS